MTAHTIATMAGRMHVTPGAPIPHNLTSSRQDWASRLSAGQPLAAVPGLMASLFSLCGNAHRVAAQLAIDAASPNRCLAPSSDIGERLRLETAQEHIRRIGLDWPRLLATETSSAAMGKLAVQTLSTCPALKNAKTDVWPALHDWLKNTLLQIDPAAWLHAWLADAGDWLQTWSQTHDGWLARLLRDARHADTPDRPLTSVRALLAHSKVEHLLTLSTALAFQPGFALQPVWQGASAHTGPWARLQTPSDQAPLSPWAMLGCRLAELVRLCLPATAPDHGVQWLRWGALSTLSGQGLGWVEMARGLLVHQVMLSDDGATAQTYCVLAPTEWNFNPHGEVAQRLAAMDPHAPQVRQQVRLLMAAFDPCVPFELTPVIAKEAQDA